MSDVTIVKLARFGWPQDEAPQLIDESLLKKTEGTHDDENEYTTWTEWRLDGKLVKRAAQVNLKKCVSAEVIAALLGG
jgi:hypothetical protein